MKKAVLGLVFSIALLSATPFVFATTFPVIVDDMDFENTVVVLETSSGNITIEFFPNHAPNHVENFIGLSQSGYYDGTFFHRVIPGFMIQGGDIFTKELTNNPEMWGMGGHTIEGPETKLDAEFNDIKHNRGIVSMARSQSPDSAGSQFFIVHENSNFLDGKYTVFARILGEESFATLDKIASFDTNERDVPLDTDQVKIIKALVTERPQGNEIEMALPEMTAAPTAIQNSVDQVFESNYFGIKFNAPEGWLIQQPPKSNPGSPDIVAVGASTGGLPPSISITIKDHTGKTFDEIIEEKNTSLIPLVEAGNIEILTQEKTKINGNEAYVLSAHGKFQLSPDKETHVKFKETILSYPDTIYSFTYTNEFSKFIQHEETFDKTIGSFELLSETKDTTEVPSEIVIEDLITETQTEEEGGGCLIATAAYGSEMAPQVQFLRELRDNTVLQTHSGTAFMTGFNQFYYSFSPAVADYERENPMFKEAVKVTLTPLLTSLAILNYVDIDTEDEMLGYGIGVILLNIGMYFVAPAAVIIALKKRRK